MDWWKLFSGTFILIFLAELGDKTQLAAMAKTADSPGDSSAKWVVFLAASLALVASTFIAVFLGHLLKTLVPDERYIKIAAALFLVFGFMILIETGASFRGEKAPEPAPVPAGAVAGMLAEPGLIGELALGAALDFESFTGRRYRRLARAATPELAELFTELAREEDSHMARLRRLPEPVEAETIAGEVPAVGIAPSRLSTADGIATLSELIRHEEATADFYQALADRALIPSLKAIFRNLTEEERSHARRLAEAELALRRST